MVQKRWKSPFTVVRLLFTKIRISPKSAGILARTDKNDPGKFRNFPEELGPKNAKKHIKNAILKSSPIIYEKWDISWCGAKDPWFDEIWSVFYFITQTLQQTREHGKPDSTVVRPLFTDPEKKTKYRQHFKKINNFVSGKFNNQVRRYTLAEMSNFGVFADTNVLYIRSLKYKISQKTLFPPPC